MTLLLFCGVFKGEFCGRNVREAGPYGGGAVVRCDCREGACPFRGDTSSVGTADTFRNYQI